MEQVMNACSGMQRGVNRMDIKREIDRVAAVNSGDAAFIGFLTWHTISIDGICAQDLEELLGRYGFTKFMPRPRNAADAARCAMTDSAESRSVNNSETVNRFFVEVCTDRREVVWKLVEEQIDRTGRSLRYNPDVATIRFDRDQEILERVDYMATKQEPIGLIDEALRLYEDYKNTYTDRHVRDMVARMLSEMSPIPVRSSGGVYFVPIAFEQSLEKLVKLVNELGRSESYKIPLINTVENRDMVRKKLDDYIRNTVRDVAEFLKGDRLDRSAANVKLQSVRKVMDDFKEYQRELSISMGDMTEVLELLRQQSLSLLDRLAA